MSKPKFKVDKHLDELYGQLKSKAKKPEFGNADHIAAVRYHEAQEDFIKKLRIYCRNHDLDPDEEINTALDQELDYDVYITYHGKTNYTISARNAKEAERIAEEKFTAEWVGDLNVYTDIKVK